MDQQKKHRRIVSFSDVKKDQSEDSTKARNRMKSESFRQERSIMKEYNNNINSKEREFTAISIAAAAYAIYSLEETRAEFERRMVESFREDPIITSKNNNSSFRKKETNYNKDDNTTFELPNLESLVRRSSVVGGQGSKTRSNSTRGIEISGREQRGGRRVGSKAEAWEQARLAKINKWYEKTRNKIIEWENQKKKSASVEMERRKVEIERSKRMNLLHYKNKIDRIEDVARGARKQLHEKKKSDQIHAKQQANKIASTGRLPVQCFCFEY